MTAVFDEHLMSDTYWHYEPGEILRTRWYFPFVCRPVVRSAAGTIRSVHTNEKNGLFSCSWSEDPDRCSVRYTELYVPGTVSGDAPYMDCDLEETDDGTFIRIPASGKPETRSVRIHYNRNTAP